MFHSPEHRSTKDEKFDWNLNVSTWNYICSCENEANLQGIISEIKNDGFGVELWMNWTPDKGILNRDNWNNIKKWISGIRDVTIHSECSNKDFEGVKKEIELTSYLKARLLVVHVLNFGVVEAENKLEIDKKYFNEVLKLAKKNRVMLALENGCFALLKQFLEAADDLQNLGICLDIGHANIPASSMLPKGCLDPIETFIEEFGSKILHLHIHDNLGNEDNHRIPGEGNINWAQVVKHLKNLNYQLYATLELRENISDARKASLQARNFLNNLKEK